ncbi:MAG: cyclase family protein [Firmicutes bacterium]|nr:cyclase family protein [Bacillota bacterium]
MIQRRRIYDISTAIEGDMTVYKNKEEKRPSFERTADFPTNGARETRLHMDAHSGTHVDAPLHMLEGGATIETIAIEDLVRPCRVLDLTTVEDAVHADDLRPFAPQAGDFLLFKTRNSWREDFDFSFVYLAADGAEYLASCKVAGVGVDALGVERAQPDHDTHKALFRAGAVIIEGLRLKDVPAGTYEMIAAPLKIIGIDAAPARVLLIEPQA